MQPDESPEVIEGDAEELPMPAVYPEVERERLKDVEPSPSTDLEVRPPSSEVLTPLDPEQVVAAMEAYQALLPKLLKPEDWQKAGRDEFVKKSGWRKIARAFNLSVFKISSGIERDEDGTPLRASAVYRAMAPNGQIQDGDGYCSAGESSFSTNKAKLEHDMAATATTRAKNRAISDLVGMGEVSAEEVVEGQNALQFPLATDEQKAELRTCLEYLFPPDEAKPLWGQIKSLFGGELYGPVANAVSTVIKAHKGRVDAERTEAQEALNAERDASDG